MISAPTPGANCRENASSTPPVPPGGPTSSPHQRVASIHWCSRSPAWPKGASRVCPSPVPKPSSEMAKLWTRVRDIVDSFCQRPGRRIFAVILVARRA